MQSATPVSLPWGFAAYGVWARDADGQVYKAYRVERLFNDTKVLDQAVAQFINEIEIIRKMHGIHRDEVSSRDAIRLARVLADLDLHGPAPHGRYSLTFFTEPRGGVRS